MSQLQKELPGHAFGHPSWSDSPRAGSNLEDANSEVGFRAMLTKPQALPHTGPNYRRMSLFLPVRKTFHRDPASLRVVCHQTRKDKRTLLGDFKPHTVFIECVLIGIEPLESTAAILVILIVLVHRRVLLVTKDDSFAGTTFS